MATIADTSSMDTALQPFIQAHYGDLDSQMFSEPLRQWCHQLPGQLLEALNPKRWGDLPQWLRAYSNLPECAAVARDFSGAAVSITRAAISETASETQHPSDQSALSHKTLLQEHLMALGPWRKGPFHFFGIDIDAEWQSNQKWDRINPHLCFKNKRILDVGCGNGYYGWRMIGENARSVLGIDPSPRCIMQWASVKRYCPDSPLTILPLGIEQLPRPLNCFDLTLSMGVLYHRRSAFDHLLQLRDTLRPGGELVLETLVVPGPAGTTLLPASRYAKMRNVWLIPSSATLLQWLARCGFENARVINETRTTTTEQRATDWMRFESLADFLDPNDPSRTIEGYPAPTRVVIIANKKL